MLGNHYFLSQPLVAAQWFEKGLPFAQQEISYLNNYAVLLSEQGCQAKATTLIEAALKIAPNDSNLLDSQKNIYAAHAAATGAVFECPL